MQAETLNCPMCGASAADDATECRYCGARLATIACPSCFGMMFNGTKFCPRCGARAARASAEDLKPRRCPRCRVEMEAVTIGKATLHECAKCDGLWAGAEAFEQICADREQQSAVLGAATLAPQHAVEMSANSRVSYVPCPECGQLMNRVNFARCSGVVVDVCKGHGTWFDRTELQQIVEFIRAGGLETSRAREKREIEEERRQLRQEQLAAAQGNSLFNSALNDHDEAHTGVLFAASGLLKLL